MLGWGMVGLVDRLGWVVWFMLGCDMVWLGSVGLRLGCLVYVGLGYGWVGRLVGLGWVVWFMLGCGMIWLGSVGLRLGWLVGQST